MDCFTRIVEISTALGTCGATIVALWLAYNGNTEFRASIEVNTIQFKKKQLDFLKKVFSRELSVKDIEAHHLEILINAPLLIKEEKARFLKYTELALKYIMPECTLILSEQLENELTRLENECGQNKEG